MDQLKRRLMLALATALVLSVAVADEKGEKKAAKAVEKRQEIDKVAQATLDELFEKSEKAKKLYDQAHGYAVFSNYKFQFFISGGGGSGVAVGRNPASRTYMKMGTGGVGLGIGGKKYSLVLLFEDKRSFDGFVDKGWQADTQASAAAGSAAAEVASTFKNGVAYYQITEKGLIASADVSGTKFWKDSDLNKARRKS